MLRNILLGVGIAAVLLSVLIFSGKIPIGNQATKAQGDVVMWGTIPDTTMDDFLKTFNPEARTYAVRYTYVPERDFNQKLLEALASGNGPDLILTPYQITLSQSNRILPFPATNLGEKAFKDTYVDGAAILYTRYGALALPVSVEPMVLIYNRAMLSKRGFPTPPQYWDEVTAMTPALTVRENNQFIESAIALGTPNVPYAKDIIMAIVSQLGQTPVVTLYNPLGEPYLSVTANDPSIIDASVRPLTTVNRYFTQFGDPGQTTYTWSDSLGNADDRFVAERLAMYVGYAGELGSFRARNPRGEFEMTVLPQTRGYNTFSMGMNMYTIAVLKTSKNPATAFTVQAQFSGGEISPQIAAMVGGVTALRSFASTPGLDQVIARSMLVARGWYDSYQDETSMYASTMISDIINYRYGVVDATSIFISRLKDIYSRTK